MSLSPSGNEVEENGGPHSTAAMAAENARLKNTPIDVLLDCPKCGVAHIDKPQPEKGWTNPPHRTHECQSCGHQWRPYEVATNGIENPLREMIDQPLRETARRDGMNEAARIADAYCMANGHSEAVCKVAKTIRDAAERKEQK